MFCNFTVFAVLQCFAVVWCFAVLHCFSVFCSFIVFTVFCSLPNTIVLYWILPYSPNDIIEFVTLSQYSMVVNPYLGIVLSKCCSIINFNQEARWLKQN